MGSTQQEIKSEFDALLLATGSPGQRVRSRIDNGSPLELRASCTFPDKNIVLEIGPIQNSWLPQSFKKPRIKGLSINISSQQKKPGGSVTLLLELQQKEAMDVFIVFVTRVCEELDALKKPGDAVKAVIAIVERWKGFFSGSSEILSEGQQTGLYGELYLLSLLEVADISLSKVVNAWTGSKRTDQDYEFGALSIEVKSSAAVDATSVNITNARQLDDTGLETLYLCRILLDTRQGDKYTLPVLISSIRNKIQQSAPELSLDFEEKILDAGYQDKHVEHYANRSYSERSVDFYEIKDNFPRLLEKDLPTGITKTSYELTREACKDYKIPTDEAVKTVKDYCDRES